jgi:hypothetical protein
MNDKIRTTSTRSNLAIRRGLWVVGLIVAAGIGIAGFSIASSLLIA